MQFCPVCQWNVGIKYMVKTTVISIGYICILEF